jgi:hypothetical protein
MSDGCGGEGQGVPRALGLPSQQLDRQLLPGTDQPWPCGVVRIP